MEINKKDVLNILFQSEVQLTAQAYIIKIKEQFSISMLKAKKILKQLIEEQELSYQYLYGATYVEKSFLKPVSVTKNFILKPSGFQSLLNQKTVNLNKIRQNKNNQVKIDPGTTNQIKIDPGKIEIIIEQGLSFGSGQHPTTRLSLQAIDIFFLEKQLIDSREYLHGADIGTGSCVLAMAMCMAGLSTCKAYEIDPVSIREAKKNISHNHLEQKIEVIENIMKESKDTFSIITANLRTPTLATLSSIIFNSLKNSGLAILSGLREWEKDQLFETYFEKGFDLVWQKSEKKWVCVVLKKI